MPATPSTSESVLTVERIVEDDDLRRLVRIVVELGEEQRERQGALVARSPWEHSVQTGSRFVILPGRPLPRATD
jgi:hypothetical protein